MGGPEIQTWIMTGAATGTTAAAIMPLTTKSASLKAYTNGPMKIQPIRTMMYPHIGPRFMNRENIPQQIFI